MGIGFWMGINLKESRVARKVGGATQSRPTETRFCLSEAGRLSQIFLPQCHGPQ